MVHSKNTLHHFVFIQFFFIIKAFIHVFCKKNFAPSTPVVPLCLFSLLSGCKQPCGISNLGPGAAFPLYVRNGASRRFLGEYKISFAFLFIHCFDSNPSDWFLFLICFNIFTCIKTRVLFPTSPPPPPPTHTHTH